ncbi:MAG TPA: hypothetical protein VM784_03310 [Actinomycetota bacterium]|nr:hypothetical protein [Actinomycetota bacterium]
MRGALFLAGSLLFVAVGCFGDGELTSSGKGRPQVEVEFPASVRAGSVADATITVTNPGPGDMSGVAITFARVGNFYPIVDVASGGENPAVANVDPEPDRVDRAAVVYRFGALREGESGVYRFGLVVPDRRGPAANSVTVSAAEDLERIRGLRLETVVE